MGYSCTAVASEIERDWSNRCYGSTGRSNEYVGTDGRRYFYQIGRENRDGSITGTVFRFLPDGEHVTKAGSFRINADGTVARKPCRFPH